MYNITCVVVLSLTHTFLTSISGKGGMLDGGQVDNDNNRMCTTILLMEIPEEQELWVFTLSHIKAFA